MLYDYIFCFRPAKEACELYAKKIIYPRKKYKLIQTMSLTTIQ